MSKTPRPHSDDDEKRPPSKGGKVGAWILTVLLVIGLGGFGVTNFGGTVTSIGSVGDTRITTQDYARAVQQEMAAFSAQVGTRIGMTEALAFGLDRQALSSIVTRTALDNEAARIGLSIGDASVAAEVTRNGSFTGASGGFDRETYRFVLDQQGWTEAEYESATRRDVARALLQGAVSGGFTAPAPMVDTLYRWIAERRALSTLRLTEADLTAPLPEPTEDDLKAWHEANIATFTKPEAKRIAYVALLPDSIAAEQPVDEAALRRIYDERIDEFVVPERRLVERLVFPDQAAADAAKSKLDAGTAFDILVAERGLTMDAVDMGDVSQEDLGPAGAAVFAAAEGAVIAAESDLGPALFRINGILQGEETTFDEARPVLAYEMQSDAARRLIADKVEEIDDLLAGGAEFQDLATEMGMTYATLDYVPGQQGTDPIEGYTAFRSAADAVTAEDFPEAIVLDDGGVVALQFVETVPSAPIPLEEAREAVTADWRAARLREALSARAIEIKAAVEGGAAIGSFGIVDTEEGDFIAVLRLNAVMAAEEAGEEAEALKEALSAQIEQALANDAMAAYADALIGETGVVLDQSAITAVNTSLQ